MTVHIRPQRGGTLTAVMIYRTIEACWAHSYTITISHMNAAFVSNIILQDCYVYQAVRVVICVREFFVLLTNMFTPLACVNA